MAAKFGDLDDALVDSVLTYTQQQLRSQLAARTRVVDDKAAADVTLDMALTGLGAQPEGKTALDLVPLRLITGVARSAAMGKVLEAAAVMEKRLSQSASSKILRESKHELVGNSTGRADMMSAMSSSAYAQDKDKDGKPATEEAKALPLVSRNFSRIDKDKLGYVTLERLKSMSK